MVKMEKSIGDTQLKHYFKLFSFWLVHMLSQKITLYYILLIDAK